MLLSQPQPIPAPPLRLKDDAKYDIRCFEAPAGVNSILEDSRGNLWFGTWEGMIRYDGTSITHYTTEEGLCHNWVLSLSEDSKGNLWFGTADGLNRYDGEQFILYTTEEGLSHNSVGSIMEDSHGNLWFGTSGGVSSFDGSSFTHFTTKEGLINDRVLSILEDSHGNLWFGTSGGVSSFDGSSFTHYSTEEGLCHNSVKSIMQDSRENLWFGTNGGVNRFDGSAFTHYTTKEGLSHDRIFSIMEDSQNNFLFATLGGGVNRLYLDDDQISFTHYTTKEGLCDDNISSIMEDSQGNLWFGTGGGVSRYDANSFKYYDTDYNFVGYISEDSHGNLWFGTLGGGVIRYDGINFTHYTKKEGLSHNSVGSIMEDGHGNLWFGTLGGGVNSFDGSSFTNYTTKEGLSNDFIESMLEDSQGDLWFGAVGLSLDLGGGLSRFDGNSFTQYTSKEGLSQNAVRDMLEDRKGHLWFGTWGGGIVRLNTNNHQDSFIYYTFKENLDRNKIESLFEDSQGNLWFGTPNGLIHYYPENEWGSFTYYGTKEGLSHDWVTALSEDNQKNIWITTSKGITALVPNSKKSDPAFDDYRLFTFGKEDGLKSLDFGVNSTYLDSKNRVWWGSQIGLTMLDLNNFKWPTNPPRIKLSHIDIKQQFVDYRRLQDTSYRNTFSFGESLSHSFDSVIAFYNYPERMELPHHLNHLTFHFSAIDWAAPHKIKYSYMLEGLDEDWSIPKSENKADYRNLPFGEFTLKVKAIGAAQVWSQPFEYTFSIRPPWWRTWWAYLLYALAIAGILFILYRFLLNRQLELAETRRLKELDAVKATFYANITHEFRTPLAIIQGMANQVQRHPGRWLDEGVTAIRRSCKELLRLVNQILDLSKLEAGHLQYNPVHGDIIPFLQYLLDSFHSMAQEKGVALSIECELEHLDMDYDQDLVSHIVSNLLSNGLKFTPRNGKVLLRAGRSFEEGKESFLLAVEDNGQGMLKDQLPHIFDRFYQAPPSPPEGGGVTAPPSVSGEAMGTGIGLALVKEIVDLLGGKIDVESQVGKGTSFTVSLPITRQAPLAVKDIPLPSTETGILAAEEEMKTSGKPLREDAPLILLVEDNEGVIRYLNSLLCHRYRLDKAGNGREGLEKAAEIGPGLIISDVMMPEMDGYTFCEKIKADKATSHIPVILLTARATHEGRKEGLTRGADAYIVKPFDQEELFIRIEQLLGLRQKLKEKYWNAARLHLLEDLDVAPRYAAFLEKLDEHIWENIDNPAFKVDQMAAAMYMSRSALFTELKEITGKSPSDYLRDARLALADQLVRNTDLPLNQVAERTGFSSDSYLTKVYRKKFGSSPSEVRGESAE